MSLYNMLFGVNPMTPVFVSMLELTQGPGEWPMGRFRNIFLIPPGDEGGGHEHQIHLYTRNGGGNRECISEYMDEPLEELDCYSSERKRCECYGCVIEHILPQHPQYLRDFDDEFDSTYATIVFSVPEKYQAHLGEFTDENQLSPAAQWERFFDKLHNDRDCPEVQEALSKLKPTMDELISKIQDGEGGTVEV